MEWWEVLVQQTINGLTRGAVFALIALGYTMVYGIIELINFAHGDVFMLGLFVSLTWFTLLGATKTLTGWQLVTFLIGRALAGAAGLIQGMYYNIGQWWMGYQAGLRAFTAAVLGGIGNMTGAALGGLFIGFLSAWSDQYISARWTNAIVFAILILVLVFRPHGLMGEQTPEKV